MVFTRNPSSITSLFLWCLVAQCASALQHLVQHEYKSFKKETHVLDTRLFFRFLCYHKVEKGQCHDIFTPNLFR